jgi:hypothetical protein
MALVRISRQLITEVEGRINHLRVAEVNATPAPSCEVRSFIGDGAEHLAAQILWGEHLHLKSQMPASWVNKAQTAAFETLYRHDDGHNETTAQVKFTGVGVAVPPGTSVGWEGKIVVRVPYSTIEEAAADDLHVHHIVARHVMAVVEREKSGRKIGKVWNDRQAQIVQFLNKCKSLNEAIKLWPQVKLYVPRNYIDTVETAVVRSPAVVRKEKVTEGLDSDGLTAAAIAARLAGVI